MKLRVEQDQAVSAAINEFKVADRTTVQMACGSGKTLVGAEVALQLQAKIIVVVAPTIVLCKQNADEWKQVFEHKPILVNNEHTLDPTVIQTRIDDKQRNVVFTTYHSLATVSDALQDTIDVIVFDEAHNTTGIGFWRFGLDNRNIRSKKRLFLTATRSIYTDDSVVHMDNEALYGKVCFDYSFRQAIEDKRLVDFKVIVPVITKRENGWTNSPDVVSKIVQQLNLNKGITFHSNTTKATAFGKLLDLTTFTITSKTKQDAREHIVNVWKDSPPPAVITNCRIFGEGFNIPAVDFVAIIDPKTSPIALIQIIGRTMRLSNGKECGYVIVPIIANDESSIDEAMDTNYASLRHVVEALQTLDSGFAADIQRYKNDPTKENKKKITGKFQIDANDEVLFDRIAEDVAVGFYRAPKVDTTDEQIDLLKNTSLSVPMIAAKCGTTNNKVSRTNIKYGIGPVMKHNVSTQETIELLKNTDWTYRKIAEELSTSETQVSYINVKHNVRERTRPVRGSTILKQIELLKNTDWTLERIGKECGVSHGAVAHTNNKHKIRGKCTSTHQVRFLTKGQEVNQG